MPWREISRGLNLYLPKDEREGKEARRLKPRRNLWHVASTSSEIVVELHRNGNEGANERSNERTNTWRRTRVRVFLYLLLFVLCCFVVGFFFSNHKCADDRSKRHQPMTCWSPPTEGMNDRRKARTKKWRLKPDWDIIGKSVANVGWPPKTPSYVSFGAMGRDLERV